MPILIAHRGNLNGPCQEKENNPVYLKEAIDIGFHVETDVWYIDGHWWLGHDCPQYYLDDTSAEELFLNSQVWCHCKNFEALAGLRVMGSQVHCFWHQEDDYTLTSQGIIWAYPGKYIQSSGLFEPKIVAVMPERCGDSPNVSISVLNQCYGICTDEVFRYRGLLR